MTRLSACYFCGTALDEPLADYPVVPADRRTDDADVETVTLCPGCHRKLEAVLEVAVDSVAADDATLGPDDGDSFTADADDVLADPDEATGQNASGTSDDAASVDAADPTADVDASGRADATSPGDDGPSTEDAPASEPGEDSTDDGDASEQSVVEGRHSISALEYNKVMRLLQNREFPVDREEIEVVAANAYQIGQSDCAKVIDVAIDRGLIEEVDGQLRKPENA